MDYNTLLDLVTSLGYHLAMSGAETFRVEESINRVLDAYGIASEVFAIPNCLTVSIETSDGIPMTRMRRIGQHGNDLDSVERFSNLSRRICAEKPAPRDAVVWLQDTVKSCRQYKLPMYLVGNFLGACGFAIFFGGSVIDSLYAGLCGILVGMAGRLLQNLKINVFFQTITAAFIMALAAYSLGATGFLYNTDAVIIGALMILVPGLLFTNAMRDIIFGDTNSGINRIVQVLLLAFAIAVGTGTAWNISGSIWGIPETVSPLSYSYTVQCISSLIGCIGFSILFNIHGPGALLCTLGGCLAWAAYCTSYYISGNEILSYLCASIVASIYSEIMARIRKYPAISYLVVACFPLLPGAGIYYTANSIVRGDMAGFSQKGIHTVAIACALAIGILLVSSTVRSIAVRRK